MPRPSFRLISAALNLGLPLAVATGVAVGTGWPWLLLALVFVNAWLFILMVRDKAAARAHPHPSGQINQRSSAQFAGRTPESTLLLLTLLGATPAMFAARHMLHHKSSKAEFVNATYGILIAQLALAIYFHTELLTHLLNWVAAL